MNKPTTKRKETAQKSKTFAPVSTEVTENTNAQSASAKRLNTLGMQEWKNYHFFTCDGEKREDVINLLKERDYLLPSELPNQETITEEARFFAGTLAERVAGNRRAQRFGLQNITDNIAKLVAMQDLSTLYFYITNLYGMTFWRVPYNLQRLPVNPDAFSMYLSVFSDAFIGSIADMNTGETEAEQEYEED